MSNVRAQFDLYRLKIEAPPLSELFHPIVKKNPSNLIVEAIGEKPTISTRFRPSWHIGNVVNFEGSLFFALGKTTESTRHSYDSLSRNFRENQVDEARYTDVVFVADLQVCAILRKSAIARPPLLARHLSKLINQTDIARQHGIQFAIDPIPDPEDFLNVIRNASFLIRFEFTFGQPNPFDVENLIHKPQERLCQEIRAKGGRTAVSGENLKPEIAEAITRSVSSTGNTARVSYKQDEDGPTQTKSLTDRQLSILSDYPENDHKKRSLLSQIKNAYRRIREEKLS